MGVPPLPSNVHYDRCSQKRLHHYRRLVDQRVLPRVARPGILNQVEGRRVLVGLEVIDDPDEVKERKEPLVIPPQMLARSTHGLTLPAIGNVVDGAPLQHRLPYLTLPTQTDVLGESLKTAPDSTVGQLPRKLLL